MTALSPVQDVPPVPTMSIVVAVDTQRLRGARCLGALLAQRGIERCEIVLLDAGHGDFPSLEGSDRPGVRVLPLARGVSYGAALTCGVQVARAPIVAFLEEHVVALPGWVEAIVAAHDEGGPRVAAVGAEMHFDNPDRGASDLIDLLAVGPWMAPAVAGDSLVLRWQNVSYKRDVLLRYGDRLPFFLDAEAVFFSELRADGFRLHIAPAAKLRHASERSFALFLRGAFISNRLGASTRTRLLHFSTSRRALCAAAALVNIARAPGYILRQLKRSSSLDEKQRLARRNLPYLVVYACAFSLGACTGYLAGRGSSGARFLDYELNAARDISGYEDPPVA